VALSVCLTWAAPSQPVLIEGKEVVLLRNILTKRFGERSALLAAMILEATVIHKARY